MSKIEELIQQLCPEGVKFEKLGKVAKISNGKDHKHLQYGNIPVYGSGGIMRYADESLFDKESVLIPRKGSIGNIFYVNTPFWTVDTIFYTKINCELINPKFLYYFLKTRHLEDLNFAGGVPSLTKSILDKVTIPLPPLPVQQEIVTILDKFTQLEAELEAELEARKRQYEYYRNQLLNFEGKEVEWIEMENAFYMKNGYTPSKAKLEFWEDGTLPWFRMEDIRANGRILSDSIQHITSGAVKGNGLFPANSIIVSTSATIGEHALITVDFLSNQRFTCLIRKHEYNERLNIYFLQYYMFAIDEWCRNNINISGFAGVDMPRFKKLKIPIPPLPEQERIVAILDKFDALVNDISVGLPAEIKARRKQYEYYRGKLLDFKCINNG